MKSRGCATFFSRSHTNVTEDGCLSSWGSNVPFWWVSGLHCVLKVAASRHLLNTCFFILTCWLCVHERDHEQSPVVVVNGTYCVKRTANKSTHISIAELRVVFIFDSVLRLQILSEQVTLRVACSAKRFGQCESVIGHYSFATYSCDHSTCMTTNIFLHRQTTDDRK